MARFSHKSTKTLTALRQLQKDRGFVPQKQNRDCQGAAPEPPQPSGFVPLPCPEDEEIDPADWARAFETRNKIWNKPDAA